MWSARPSPTQFWRRTSAKAIRSTRPRGCGTMAFWTRPTRVWCWRWAFRRRPTRPWQRRSMAYFGCSCLGALKRTWYTFAEPGIEYLRQSGVAVMNLIKVDSSMIYAVGYDEEAQILEVVFKRTGVYRYRNVPKNVYEGLLASDSKS